MFFYFLCNDLFAGDSTKLRAQNSKKNNFNEGKIERNLTYIDAKLDEYNKALAEADDHKTKTCTFVVFRFIRLNISIYDNNISCLLAGSEKKPDKFLKI